jgi:tetratricopeptide (TPR) repeat protein
MYVIQEETNRFGGRQSAAVTEDGTDNGNFYAAAVTYGRKRRYREALESLRQALERGECSQAEALDLKARIFVQQGRLLDAEACWTKAQAIDGSNTAYADALARLRRRAQPLSHLYPVAAGTLALTLIGALAVYSAIEARSTARQGELRYSELAQANAAVSAANADKYARIETAIGELDKRISELAQADAVASAANADKYARIETAIGELDKNMKLLAKTDDVKNTGDSFRTEIERLGAAVNSLQASLAAQTAANKQEAEMIRSQFDSALGKLKANTAALLAQLDDRVNTLVKRSPSNPEP